MWVASLIVTPLSLLWVGFDLGDVTSSGYMAVAYAALVGTFSGMMLAFYNIKRFGATAAAIMAYVIPVVATLGGVLFLDEQVTTVMVLGMGLIIAGIALTNRGMRIAPEEGTPITP
jgi:drug/metabolite transporter (DMT)-like permease